jgi:microcystin-dependent protein
MWSGAVANLPLGWAVCDGSDVPGYGLVPDLSDRFIIGFSTARPIGDTGGALVRDTEDAGSHNHPINGTTLTVAQMPNHTHRMWAWDGEGKGATQWSFGYDGADVAVIGDGDLAAGSSAVRKYLQTNADGRALIETSGAAQSHSHTTDAAGGHSHGVTILPKYYAMAFIIKTSEYEIE